MPICGMLPGNRARSESWLMTTIAMTSRNEHNATLASSRRERLFASGAHREASAFVVLPPCHIRRLDWARRLIPRVLDLRSSDMMKQRQLDDPEEYQPSSCHQI